MSSTETLNTVQIVNVQTMETKCGSEFERGNVWPKSKWNDEN